MGSYTTSVYSRPVVGCFAEAIHSRTDAVNSSVVMPV